MSLATRIIPTVLNKNGQMVKGKSFAKDRVVGHAYQASKIYGMRSVDELILLDVMATQEQRPPDYEGIAKLAENLFVPLTVGGGVDSLFKIRALLKSGADKISICKAAIDNTRFVMEAADKFGSSTITVCMDGIGFPEIGPFVEEAIKIEKAGAGELLIQNIKRDGTLEGYDLEMIHHVSNNVNIPVIASGGCSGYHNMHEAIHAGASAVAASSLFLFTDATPKGAAEYLNQKGVEVRL